MTEKTPADRLAELEADVADLQQAVIHLVNAHRQMLGTGALQPGAELLNAIRDKVTARG